MTPRHRPRTHRIVQRVPLAVKSGTVHADMRNDCRRHILWSKDWHEIGLHEDLTIDKEVRPFKFTFRATGILAKKNRIGFVMGDETGDLIVKEMTLTENADKK